MGGLLGYRPDFSEASPSGILGGGNPMAVDPRGVLAASGRMGILGGALQSAAARYRVAQPVGSDPTYLHDFGLAYGGPVGGMIGDLVTPPDFNTGDPWQDGLNAGMMFSGIGGPAKWETQTFSHPISGVKLKTAIEEMHPTYDTQGVKMLPEKSLHPESLQGGYVIPMRGDPTIAGKRLTGVGGEKFEDPVTLHGGPAFARGPQQIAEGAGWASNPAPSTALSKRAAEIASKTGDPVFGAYMKMSPTSGDYSTMMSETLREMVKLNPPSRKGVREFNKAMREEWNGFPATPGFPGVENLTDEWIRTAGKHRTKLAQMMDSKRFGDLGFPEVGVARHAITEPDLLDVPSHSSGFSVVQFPSSGEVIKNPKIAHPTYAQQNKATYEGRLPELPLDVLYGPEVRASTKPEYLAKILETKPPTVKVDQKTLDRVMKYLRSQDGAKWGIAGAVAGGLLTAEQAKELKGT